MNAGILQDPGYYEKVRDTITWNMESKMFVEDKRIWWDNLKFDIKELSTKHSKQVQNNKKKQKENLVRNELETELQKIT